MYYMFVPYRNVYYKIDSFVVITLYNSNKEG